jgi:hypothetical protein
MITRDEHLRREEETRRLRVAEAAARMELFRRTHGRDALTAEELRLWAASNPPENPFDPSKILSAEQIASALRDCLRDR